jgi:hypothetical protein
MKWSLRGPSLRGGLESVTIRAPVLTATGGRATGLFVKVPSYAAYHLLHFRVPHLTHCAVVSCPLLYVRWSLHTHIYHIR